MISSLPFGEGTVDADLEGAPAAGVSGMATGEGLVLDAVALPLGAVEDFTAPTFTLEFAKDKVVRKKLSQKLRQNS